MTTIHILAAVHSARQEIKKSRFLATAGPVRSEGEAKAFIAAHSDPAATHNCWAWRVGQAYRFSDDGEPGGTAGKPILQALDGQMLDCVAVVVTRWFGGVLLGSGGLIRAYGGTAAACLRAADKLPLIETVDATISCVFADLALVEARLTGLSGARITARNYTATGGVFSISINRSELEATLAMVADITSGRAEIAAPR